MMSVKEFPKVKRGTLRQVRPQRCAHKRKGELVAPACAANCQVAHTIEQAAAILSCSVKHVRRLLEAEKLQATEINIGGRRHVRIEHTAIHSLLHGSN